MGITKNVQDEEADPRMQARACSNWRCIWDSVPSVQRMVTLEGRINPILDGIRNDCFKLQDFCLLGAQQVCHCVDIPESAEVRFIQASPEFAEAKAELHRLYAEVICEDPVKVTRVASARTHSSHMPIRT
jgi:hypothetical protein